MIIFGRPVRVPRDADKETMEAKRAELERVLIEITEKADGYWDRR